MIGSYSRQNRIGLFFVFVATSKVGAKVPTSRKRVLPQTDMPGNSDAWNGIGGGAVNEKVRTQGSQDGTKDLLDNPNSSGFNPSNSRAHLFHALEGLDRYPNYLARWNESDINCLENALEEVLVKVCEQKRSILDQKKGIQALVGELLEADGDRWRNLLRPPTNWSEMQDGVLDSKAYCTIIAPRLFTQETPPTVRQILAAEVEIELDVGQLTCLMNEEMYDVYSLSILSESFCGRVREFVSEVSRLGQTEKYANLQMGRRPIDLDTIGLGWINDLLFYLILRPISRHLFESSDSFGDLNWRQGYVAAYSANPTEGRPRAQLITHTDDSEVTLNIGLGENFTGGAIEFRGLRGTPEAGKLIGTIQPRVGVALIHAGRHFHDVTTVTSGDRFALVMWARSWGGIRQQACPCCWLNRRKDDHCVCGPSWN
jgi:hypothetical protein